MIVTRQSEVMMKESINLPEKAHNNNTEMKTKYRS